MASILILVAYCLFTPLLVLWLTYKFSFLNKVGSVVVAYTIGCLVALSGILPTIEDPKIIEKTLQTIASVSVPLAIPLMLFSSDVRSWRYLAPNFVKSLLMGLVACVLVAVAGFYLFGQAEPEKFAGVSAMFVGQYTGGAANMATIQKVAGVDDATFLKSSVYVILVGVFYLMALIFAGKALFGLVLPKFKSVPEGELNEEDVKIVEKESENQLFLGLFTKQNLPSLFKALGWTIGILLLGVVFSCLFSIDEFLAGEKVGKILGGVFGKHLAIFMLSISLFAIIASLHKKVRTLPHTFDTGVYLILVFSIAISSNVGGDMFKDLDVNFFWFVMFVTMGPLLLHVLLNAVLRVDVDTTLVTSIALVTSPAFVPVMAGTLKNRSVVGPGITVGLIGYAVGSYLGSIVYFFLKSQC